jgi:hypothetical protein
MSPPSSGTRELTALEEAENKAKLKSAWSSLTGLSCIPGDVLKEKAAKVGRNDDFQA